MAKTTGSPSGISATNLMSTFKEQVKKDIDAGNGGILSKVDVDSLSVKENKDLIT